MTLREPCVWQPSRDRLSPDSTCFLIQSAEDAAIWNYLTRARTFAGSIALTRPPMQARESRSLVAAPDARPTFYAPDDSWRRG